MGTRVVGVTWQYLAGFTDGDGCISISRFAPTRPSQMQITWYQTEANAFVLDQICDFLEEQDFKCLWYEHKSTTHPLTRLQGKPVWHLTIAGVQLERALKKMLPYLIVKQERAQEALHLLATVPRGRRYEKLKECQRGHDLTDPKNVYQRPNSTDRQCRACMRLAEARRPKRSHSKKKEVV